MAGRDGSGRLQCKTRGRWQGDGQEMLALDGGGIVLRDCRGDISARWGTGKWEMLAKKSDMRSL